ncbi:unnamed protein product [Rotaria sordida]|uniref:Transmembrane protein 245 n=1 Tax=Rotaria sordida TaxID=392033 RepID=A0A814F9G7_9BILA|nr:unnamed protein product [Rotaria sordida]
MTTRQQHVDRSNMGSTNDTRVLSILNFSRKRDQRILRTAFLHSATILFVIVCGACAVIVYRILEPFLQSILWSILAGAFLFPFKNHFTSIARYYLRQFDANSYFLCYGLVIILPIQIFDKAIESIVPLCIQKWKQLILIIIFVPSIEFLQSGVIYHCITTIGYDYFVIFEKYIHHFDSPWITSLVIIYIFAVLILYNKSSVIKYILNIFSIPIWFILFIYLSQFLPVNYRLIVVTFAAILLVVGFVVEQNFIGDKKINHSLQNSIDYLVSACMIFTLFILILFGSILLVIQIHHESIHMIKLTSNLVNETIVLQDMLPDKEHMSHLMGRALTKLYVFGRNWITKQVAKVQPPRVPIKCCLPISVMGDESLYVSALGQDSLSNKKLEEQILLLWDRLYTYITNTSTLFITHKNSNRILHSSSNQNFRLLKLLKHIQKNFDFHLNDIYDLIRNNLDLLRTILDSIWSNATVILTLISTIISLLFTGGFALLNFFVSFIVFITLLFYLLSHSDQPIYQPTIWLNNILAIGGPGLGKTVNDVATSVFIASLKIAAFYGLYTYVLHTLLGSNFVFLPAVIASICAVTLQSYWAALPGCLDLWLVQQRPLSALILLLAQIAPVYIVDTAIYSEVNAGGHQYLTALAIAGGVYYRGIEGALIGPIILCCLLVGIRMYNETISTSLSSNSHQLPFSLIKMKQNFNRSPSLQSLLTRNDND